MEDTQKTNLNLFCKIDDNNKSQKQNNSLHTILASRISALKKDMFLNTKIPLFNKM